MLSGSLLGFVFLIASSALAMGQDQAPPSTPPDSTPPQTIALTVSRNTPLQVALDKEVRVRKVGQPVHGRLVQPVYAFNRMVVPAGAEVNGHIAQIAGISGKKRTMGILNADFTPARKVDVEFDELVLADGRRIPFDAVVTPGSGQIMRLVSTKDEKKKKTVGDATSEKIDEAKDEARRQWLEAMKQIKEPGKIHRLERYAVAQLPARPQYIDAGTLYFAELREPLDFGSEPVTPETFASIGDRLPQGILIHALLITPLDSATTKKGAEVEAVLAQPVLDGDQLILPEGSRLKGLVLEVRAARRLHRNGQLRIAFREVVPPEGTAQRIVASLEGVESGKDSHVKLDSEGGAEASSPRTRYISTAISLALASTSFRQHNDADDVGQSQHGGGAGAGGLAGFKLVGLVLGAAVKSQPFGMAMGAYGAGTSVYTHFIARGQDVVFPRNTVMEIGIGSRGKTTLPSPEQSEAAGRRE